MNHSGHRQIIQALSWGGWTIALAFIFSGTTSGASATTIIGPGPIVGNETWSVSGSPFLLTGDISIPAGGALSVETGVVVQFTGNYSIVVNGSLVWNATNLSSRVELAANATGPSWGGIFAGPNATLRLSGIRLSNVSRGVVCENCGSLALSQLRLDGEGGLDLSAVEGGILENVTLRGAVIGVQIANSSNLSAMHLSGTNLQYGLVVRASTNLTFEELSLVVWGPTAVQIVLTSWASFRNVSLEGASGVLLESDSHITFDGLSVTGSLGLETSSSTYVFPNTDIVLRNFDFSRLDGIGLMLNSATSVTILDGTLGAPLNYGIQGYYCSDVTVRGITIDRAQVGVDLFSCPRFRIADSTVTQGSLGLRFQSLSFANVSNVTFLNQSSSPVRLVSSTDCGLIGNNFVDFGLAPQSNSGQRNEWDDGRSGNFWFPHNYTDLDGDDRGDSPVSIGGTSGEFDVHPLMFSTLRSPAVLSVTAPAQWPEFTPFEAEATALDLLGHVTLQWSVVDPGAVLGTGPKNATIVFWSPVPSEFRVTATTLGGVVSEAMRSVAVSDTRPPVIDLTGPSNASSGTSPCFSLQNSTDDDPLFPVGASAEWEVKDPAENVSLASTNWSSFCFLVSAPGNYSIQVVGADSSGNAAAAYASLLVFDIEPPRVSGIPLLMGVQGIAIHYTPTVSDNDLGFPQNAKVMWQAFSNVTGVVTSFGFDLNITLEVPGLYAGNLTVCDAANNCAATSFVIRVLDNTPPDLSEIGPFDLIAGTPSELNASKVTDNSPTWPVGGRFDWVLYLTGGTLSLSGFRIVVSESVPGVYRGVLTVEDASGNAAQVAIIVIVDDRDPPELHLSAPRIIELGDAGLFDASASIDQSMPLDAEWDFGDGSLLVPGLLVSHTYGRVGDFEVVLRLLDSSRNQNSTRFAARVVDTVSPMVEILSPAMENNMSGADVGAPVLFLAVASDLSLLSIVEWQFGDGSQASGLEVSHTYSRAGLQNVTLRVVDSHGNERILNFAVNVGSPSAQGSWMPLLIIAATIVGLTCAVVGWYVLKRRRESA